jgi:RNA polymerase sigma factor (sigma-70 family)
MAHQQLTSVLQSIRKLISVPTALVRTDGELLERFVAHHEEAAFAELLLRYGPLVLGVCRRILNNPEDAEDAFQATFLILIRRAAALDKRGSLGSWLYTVAYHTALKARTAAARRREEERQVRSTVKPSGEPSDCELRPILDEELYRLPEKYRTPLVLCYLQGKTTAEAADHVGCPKGTLLARLARAREQLRGRLARRGLALTAAALATAVSQQAGLAAVPLTLSDATLKSALLLVAGEGIAASAASTRVAALTEGVLHTMFAIKVKYLTAVCFVLTLVLGSAGWLAYRTAAADRAADSGPPVVLPADPQKTVLLWDTRRPDLARHTEEPRLLVRADGTVRATDPYGPGKPVEIKLSARELQEVLRAVVHEHGFFQLDELKVREQLRADRLNRGLAAGAEADLPDSIIRICADNRELEVRCPDLRSGGERSPDVSKLQAVEKRLERLLTWAYAGGQPGVETALKAANEQLRRQFPEAPPLAPTDLQRAHQRADGGGELVFERRGISADHDLFSFVYAQIERLAQGEPRVVVKANLLAAKQAAEKPKLYKDAIGLEPPPIGKDPAVKYDFDIVYVRAPREGDGSKSKWAEVGDPRTMEAGAELMLLHPDGSEEVLVAVTSKESIADPIVSFDGQSVYYAKMHDARGHKGSDIYRIHVPTRKIVQLTKQEWAYNTGAADWSKTPLPSWGVYNLGPCPLPGGKVVFVSDRHGFRGTNTGYAPHPLALQLFVMDDDGKNVECIGHLNLGTALHPVVLKDGRIMFSSLESQGLRSHHLWGIWSIHPDGSNWAPLVSAFDLGGMTTDSFHFQTQLSDESIVFESYYNLNNFGFGLYFKQPVGPPAGTAPFGPGYKNDPRNPPLRNGRYGDGRPMTIRFPFTPYGLETLTPFIARQDTPAEPAILAKADSPRVGKFTHPSGAPDNHMLTAWSAGSVNSAAKHTPPFDSGIYLIKSGKPIDEPAQMVLVKNDPKYHEQWPRALVSYQRIYGVDEPKRLAPLANNGKQSPHLPEGSPFGLVGSSSLYKRESYPYGLVRSGSVTAAYGEDKDPTGLRGFDASQNWYVQGADAGLYGNEDVHGIRILVLEPNTDRQGGPKAGRLFYNHARERMRVLGEFPVRKFNGDQQPLDPDGNPDTSFLVKMPADVAWTFQTLDKKGMVLNMAQTWHQVRAGEIRHDCGGCHAHSQKPTEFNLTAAAKPDYKLFDLTKDTPLLSDKAGDQSGKKWDGKDETGLRFEKGVKNVEYFRDVKPILERSCVACHTKTWEKPAGNLVLDDSELLQGSEPLVRPLPTQIRVPGTYLRLAADSAGRFGHKPLGKHGWGGTQASRYITMLQSRRSLLIWKLHGQRLDGFSDQDVLHEAVPGDPGSLRHKGQPVADTPQNRDRSQVAYTGGVMPPPEAVAGTYAGLDGKKIKVAPLTDEDKRTFARWIDLGCPIDLDYDPVKPQAASYGWMLDDNRPTLALTYPQAGANAGLTRLLVGMHDYGTGLNLDSFQVVADFPIDGVEPGQNLAAKFQALPDNRWEMKLDKPLAALPQGKLTVSIKDRQGSVSRIERTFSVVPTARPPR